MPRQLIPFVNEYGRIIEAYLVQRTQIQNFKPRRGQARPQVSPIIEETVRLLEGADRRLVLFKPRGLSPKPLKESIKAFQLMPRESIKAKTKRTAAIISGLKSAYPDAKCELDYSSPLELLVATILSAQCTDKQVNIVTSYLFKKYRCAADYIEVDIEELQDDIKRIGLFIGQLQFGLRRQS